MDDYRIKAHEIAHDLFWARDSEVLTNPASGDEALLKLMDGLGHYSPEDRNALSEALVLHPNFSEHLVRKAIESLHAQWWGDDPMECRLAWEALEKLLK